MKKYYQIFYLETAFFKTETSLIAHSLKLYSTKKEALDVIMQFLETDKLSNLDFTILKIYKKE